jgi:hypothetical protein
VKETYFWKANIPTSDMYDLTRRRSRWMMGIEEGTMDGRIIGEVPASAVKNGLSNARV